ncbi:hypothetical protein [Microcella sp.]|uniref:hypothetical protein n=1 Tax=Microcella sp. TaxID=1913979 RepID=UPI002564AA90|nr:hypothetical protein [Microcella sp.]MBX9471076.1 hypothetical protein [Microcella sp.]
MGIALGALALVSTFFTVANTTWHTSFPTLHDATRAALQEQPADESTSPVLLGPLADADIRIASVEEERVYLTEVLTRASALIGPIASGDALPALATSTASYPHTTADGLVAIGSISHFDAGYSAGPAGGYLLTLTGKVFGTVAQFDSFTGTITLR